MDTNGVVGPSALPAGRLSVRRTPGNRRGPPTYEPPSGGVCAACPESVRGRSGPGRRGSSTGPPPRRPSRQGDRRTRLRRPPRALNRHRRAAPRCPRRPCRAKAEERGRWGGAARIRLDNPRMCVYPESEPAVTITRPAPPAPTAKSASPRADPAQQVAPPPPPRGASSLPASPAAAPA